MQSQPDVNALNEAHRKGYAVVTSFAPEATEAIRRFEDEESIAEFGPIAKAWTHRGLVTRKVAIVSAAFNFETEVSEECAKAAIAFCRWQLRLRRAVATGHIRPTRFLDEVDIYGIDDTQFAGGLSTRPRFPTSAAINRKPQCSPDPSP